MKAIERIGFVTKVEALLVDAQDKVERAINLFNDSIDEAQRFIESDDSEATRDVINWAAYEGRLAGAQDVIARALELMRGDPTLDRTDSTPTYAREAERTRGET